ncbi:hypothetical protein ACHAWC_004735 [Mediolabrus comicus]
MSTPPSSPPTSGDRILSAIKLQRRRNNEMRTSRPFTDINSCLTSRLLLRVVGTLLFVCVVMSLYIGNYYHYLNHQNGTSTATAKLRSKDHFYRDGADNNDNTDKANETINTIDEMTDYASTGSIHEKDVFESIIKRVKWTEEQCNNVPDHHVKTLTKTLKKATDLSPLPEGGVVVALEQWMKGNRSAEEENNSNNGDYNYPTCYLPPPKSCDVTTFTLVIMSHTTERLEAFMSPLADMVDSWPGLTEIIIVWNSPRTTLTTSVSNEKEKQLATKLLSWDTDPNHPLRIFFSLEEGLNNNLLNRYHPKIQPKNQAVMYFDDDGPFFSKEAMVDGGLEMWRRNSNVQVGAFPRNVRFLSNRMKELGTKGLQQSIDIIANNAHSDSDTTYPPFTPFCRNATGDHVEYNFFSFPDFNAHILLPSGSILHRNYLCFIWHPAFEELRDWVVHHKTMPDDMTVSTLVSHLSGRAPRSFPREISTVSIGARRLSDLSPIEEETDDAYQVNHAPIPNQSHRRLLWKKKGWSDMREEAINSIIGYFGSVHPGTVGWCAGTKHAQDHHKHHVECRPEKPSLRLLPWLNEGGVGYDHCPPNERVVNTIKEGEKQMKKVLEEDNLTSFCGECRYKNAVTCRDRMQYLIDKYKNSPLEAKMNTIKEDSNCKKK